jgi:hypothetical protein
MTDDVKVDPATPAPSPKSNSETSSGKKGFDLRYLNALGSGLAVFVSMVSIWLAWSSNRTQEKMLAAASWPYVICGTSNIDSEREAKSIDFNLTNGGSGPALVHWVAVTLDAKPAAHVTALLSMCCNVTGTERAPSRMVTSPATGQVITPTQSLKLFRLDWSEDVKESWDLLNQARFQVRAKVCYCSLIGDCWLLDSATSTSTPQRSCGEVPQNAWHG